MSISEEAAAARASLANEKELVRTFEVSSPPSALDLESITLRVFGIPGGVPHVVTSHTSV